MATPHKWKDVIIAMANGYDAEYQRPEGGKWFPASVNGVDPFTDPQCNWRTKPRTIKIGDFEVPEPLREAPEKGSLFFFVNLHSDPSGLVWGDQYHDEKWLSMGLCHATKEAAIAHARALIAVSNGSVE